ncbi:MAG: M48 family metalloprotease, partial [Pseudomonadota bacterium]|nr:M48 family metalloprotease [Pseudomonadota bacterium]
MILSACSTNPATGERQFASFMSPQQENQVGAQEHEKVLKQFGGLVKDKALTDYVNKIGQKLAQNTERPDVQYKFFLLDSPEANAFAIPGGYIYITRGILALANDEAELAAVLGHEIGHITGRHSAERYSHGVVTSLGAAILGAAVDNPNVARAANLGQNLYLSSYSRSQENEADMLGVRYLHRAGYDPSGMNRFLTSLGAFSALEAKANGQGAAPQVNYFSTHPLTQERVSKTAGEARKYPQNQMVVNKSDYLKK